MLYMNLSTFHENNNIDLKFQNNFLFKLFYLYISQSNTLLF